ncbi:putative protein kinase RLK-Pelle-CrRLK1L-1 family [Helianthus annuus]|uniref:Putative heavy metal-associated domain, HMA, Mitogen-activated protein (MAP) kinase, ERK3/4 n=1 Tax=Helianthus annuus TaxID=4232 RepID=A0A251T0Y3_HELAN|nr:probable receptor-like protein kinase At2g23200 isoform X2 [Helianthus annuus]KAF5777156.1 putative protein kinase RLK-Pelle-CrRLK1L-1 family [Helianthus annuus]KAJ0488748.1 putative protein kinase RLK-Pelle-CrRLK1L-1 family [Helianthus annuus]KAJ0492313.1 putative protein kinase RLK-Pelle-CrRLK1L-1 family [Helianthus annuus]KAJ0504585.1 putative protein kinase RLK-Pelle-CrRLK1L-1 family [Helianthus annuus]
MPSIEDVKHLQIPLWEISLATNGFAKENLIEEGGFGHVYKGISKKHGSIAVKRLVYRQMYGQGDKEFKTEIALLSKCKHENIVSLRGFCDEDGEKILVYRYESNGSLNKQLNNENLTWTQRLRICLDAACGLQYLHENVESQLGIFHRDVKSPNILLDEGWKAKISDFGLSRAHPANMQASFLISNPCGTEGYIDPDYRNTCHLTQKSDVYSFGVVLWEVLCGRLAYVPSYNDDRRYLNVLVEKHYIRKTLDKIIPSYLHKQMHTDSLLTFTKIAYQCLKNREERPTMKEVVDQLQEAIDHQQKKAKPATVDEKKGDGSFPPPPPQPQELVFLVYMHCKDCAKRVRRCLENFEGVEGVETDCENHKVVVKGEKADPLKVLERIHKETGRKVELLSPVTKPLVEEAKRLEQEKPSKREDEKDEEGKKEAKPATRDEKRGEASKDPPPPNVSANETKKPNRKVQQNLKGSEGVKDVHLYCETQNVLVKGTQEDSTKVLKTVVKKSHRKVDPPSPVQTLLAEEPKKPEQEPHEQAKRNDATSREIYIYIFIIIFCFIYDISKLVRYLNK